MPVISIEGTSGIGKSLLAAQLAAMLRCPVIPEGEPGVLPDWVQESIAKNIGIQQRNEWFVERCMRAGDQAHQCSDTSTFFFIDSGPLTHEAYLRYDFKTDEPMHVDTWASQLHSLQLDLLVVLADDEASLRKRISQRARTFEKSDHVVERAMAVQDIIYSLPEYSPQLVINRSQLDFTSYVDLEKIWNEIRAALSAVEYNNIQRFFLNQNPIPS